MIPALLLLAAACTLAGCTAAPAGGTGGGFALSGDVRTLPGPTAWQLAHGSWLRIPDVPIRLCDGHPVWDGSDLILIEPGFAPCHPAAASYDPADNSWRVIAAPPKAAGQVPVVAWGGGRILMVSPDTGAAVAWDKASGRWQVLTPLPAVHAISVTWTGRAFLVVTLRQLAVNRGVAEAFALRGDQWTRLPDLPQPRSGQIANVATATYRGTLYAYAGVTIAHANPNDSYTAEYPELLRLAGSAWRRVSLPAGVPLSQQALETAQGTLVALGSSCPGPICMEEAGAAALLMPGTRTRVVRLDPKPEVPYPYDVAAGGHAVIMMYSSGLGRPLLPGQGPARGSLAIYDLRTGRWLNGPTAPETPADAQAVPATVWTPFGVISVSQEIVGLVTDGDPGGWLLRPARAGR
jgi:hypothetical protein